MFDGKNSVDGPEDVARALRDAQSLLSGLHRLCVIAEADQVVRRAVEFGVQFPVVARPAIPSLLP
jgi:hypothetical protein